MVVFGVRADVSGFRSFAGLEDMVWELSVKGFSRLLVRGTACFRQSCRGRVLLQGCNIGALIIGIGIWGPLYYNSNKEPTKIVQAII